MKKQKSIFERRPYRTLAARSSLSFCNVLSVFMQLRHTLLDMPTSPPDIPYPESHYAEWLQ